MADLTTLARPYARAAFDVAQGRGALPAWSAALGFAAEIAAAPEIEALSLDPRLDPKTRLALYLSPEGAPDEDFGRFLSVLAEEGRLDLLPEIDSLFQALHRAAESQLKVRVSTALALQPDQREALITALARRFRRQIELDVKVDPSLLGGAIIDVGNQVIDGSVRGRLARLSQRLTH